MNKIKGLSQKVFVGSVLFALILFQGLVFLPVNKVSAAYPAFNTDPLDKETLRLKNNTKGTSSWQDPISAEAGDKVSFAVYYHNTADGTVAKNTKVRVDFEDNQNKKLSFKGFVWADNASYVSDTGTINVPCSGLAFVFDKTAKWYPNQGSTAKEVSVTFSQSNSALVNIGDVAGGWSTQGYVVFEGTILRFNPKFNFMEGDKETLRLKNRTEGDTEWQDPVSAKGGDTIAFDVYYHNGIVCSVARDTKVTIEFPLEVGNKIVTVGIVDANNSGSVSDEGIINVSGTAEKLTFKTTALWYPNQSTQGISLPVVISGNKATVDIGDIEGCWPYQGHVVFEAELSKTPSPTPTPAGKPTIPPEEIPKGQVLGAYTEKEIPKVPVTGASSTIALSLVSSIIGYGAIMRKKLKEKLLGSKLKSAIDDAKTKKGL